MTSMVARLRRAIENESRVVGTVSYRYTDDLDTLLTIVERFAAVDPVAEYWCDYCDRNVDSVLQPGHDPDCPWLLARRACGMAGDA